MGTNGIKLSIGMTMAEVKTLANSTTPLNTNTKNLILTFCDKDHDQVITDEGELYVLNTWLSNKQRITMPAYNQYENIGEEFIGFVKEKFNRIATFVGKDHTARFSGTTPGGDDYSAVYTDEYNVGRRPTGKSTQTILYDYNKDNLVDCYESGIIKPGQEEWSWTKMMLNQAPGKNDFNSRLPESMRRFAK